MTLNCELNTPKISLVTAQQKDAEALVSLRIEAMRESLENIDRFDPARAAERFLVNFSPKHTRHIILNEQRVGFVVAKPKDDFYLLDHLYILPAQQSQGIGSAVLLLLIEEANAQLLPVHVGALRGSASNRFYLRHGFKLFEQSEFDNYYTRQYAEASQFK
jgi:ribosomal protein S18 acetylase RimI-like enzyme